jgi:hypothetical protein
MCVRALVFDDIRLSEIIDVQSICTTQKNERDERNENLVNDSINAIFLLAFLFPPLFFFHSKWNLRECKKIVKTLGRDEMKYPR